MCTLQNKNPLPLNRETNKATSVPWKAEAGLCIAIVGPSGSGKDTIANWLCDHEGYEQIVSYTTRPMREGETQCKEHYFVTEFPEMDHFVCHTVYGGHHYWVNSEQLLGKRPTVYVVDEVGLMQLKEWQKSSGIRIFAMYVECDEEIRLKRGVTSERIERDRSRQLLPMDTYDVVVKNNKSMKALVHRLREIRVQG